MAMRMYDLEHLQHIWEPARDSRVALAWSRTTVVLAFRGTASLKNAKTDIKVCTVPVYLSKLLILPLRMLQYGGCHCKLKARCGGSDSTGPIPRQTSLNQVSAPPAKNWQQCFESMAFPALGNIVPSCPAGLLKEGSAAWANPLACAGVATGPSAVAGRLVAAATCACGLPEQLDLLRPGPAHPCHPA